MEGVTDNSGELRSPPCLSSNDRRKKDEEMTRSDNWFTALQKRPFPYRLFLIALLCLSAWFPFELLSKGEGHVGRPGSSKPRVTRAQDPGWYWTFVIITSAAPIGIGVLLAQSFVRKSKSE
jgi:hypothetical protein